MNVMLYPLLFLFGLVFGSFLNVLIWRLNAEKSPKFWQGRSICPKCKHQLAWFDNIPLFSFLVLSGKCRYCHKSISIQYPLVELLTGVISVAVAFFARVEIIQLVLLLLISYSLIVVFVSDLIYGLIPDEMVVLISVVGLIINYELGITNFWTNLLVGLLSSLAFFIVVLITRFRGMGLGDVKLVFPMGLLLGWPKMLVACWVGFILGGMAAVILLVLKKTKLSATIPLGPFLVIGFVVSALWSKEMLALLGV